jgi:hypothetical protein
VRSRFGKVKQLACPYFWNFFGVISLLRVLMLVTLQLPRAQHSIEDEHQSGKGE